MKITGATVHFVDEGMDSGPIILPESRGVCRVTRRRYCSWAGDGAGGVGDSAGGIDRSPTGELRAGSPPEERPAADFG